MYYRAVVKSERKNSCFIKFIQQGFRLSKYTDWGTFWEERQLESMRCSCTTCRLYLYYLNLGIWLWLQVVEGIMGGGVVVGFKFGGSSAKQRFLCLRWTKNHSECSFLVAGLGFPIEDINRGSDDQWTSSKLSVEEKTQCNLWGLQY